MMGMSYVFNKEGLGATDFNLMGMSATACV